MRWKKSSDVSPYWVHTSRAGYEPWRRHSTRSAMPCSERIAAAMSFAVCSWKMR
jgi:hypothetical protein